MSRIRPINRFSMAETKPKYIYDLPYCEREDLCRILDVNGKDWKTLGGLMKFKTFDIQCIESCERRGQSPSNELLTKWGSQNHTVQELFVLLSRMRHFHAMTILKPFVDPKFHILMSDGEESLTKLLNNVSLLQPVKNNAGPSASSSNAVASAVDDKTFGGHNLNVMMPDTQKLSKQGFSDSVKIQNIGSPVSMEENSPQLEKTGPDFGALGTLPSPPVLNQALGQPRLSPAGVAALSAPPNIPMAQQNIPTSARKLSVSSMATTSEHMLPMKDYKELEAATNGWNPANILGKGGFGTVYKGLWKNTVVAIKRIEIPKGDSRESQEIPYQQSQRELQVLQRIHHQNILQLYSFSFNGNQPCLVYQFMERGSLEDRLQCKNRTSPLSWQQRYNIAKGAARGLQYLHTVEEKPLIHGDIKSANILLDANFEPRIGDFGLAREGPHNHYTHMKVSRVHGTRPYLPSEFLRSKKLSTKVDTYSFGVVLFEIATGLRAYDDKRPQKFLRELVKKHTDVHQLMDPKIEKAPTIFKSFIDLGIVCVSYTPQERPEMSVVCQTLDQHTITSKPVTPRELQEYYDALRSLPQPVVQPTSPIIRHPGNYLINGQPGYPVSNPSTSHQIGTPPRVSPVDNGGSPKGANGGISPTPRLPNMEQLLPTEPPSVPNAPAVSPAISVMPPTVSEISDSSSRSFASDSSVSSREYQSETSLPPPEEDEDVNTCLPLVSVLGVNK
ncbi:serine/threonine-protein kinase RIPK-like [Thrips palmi]|uniref:non-specific serine/threonine protein kinase n=1 Tax=Thrips palmi TaxID=161013 RepID=A0A6P8YTM1_THRPL|nr:serine/threonine-protein kinase RIPK-like [Thrips palmi]